MAKTKYWYTLGLERGGLTEDPDWHVEWIKTVEAVSLREAKDAWAKATRHNGEFWDEDTQCYWGWLVVCLGTNDPAVTDLYYSKRRN